MGTSEKEIIRNLLNCVAECEHCLTACLNEADITPFKRCIALIRDCIDICSQTDRLLQRDSEIAYQFLVLCEEVCRKCAEECKKHAHHEHCRRCAEVCLACAHICHEHHEPILQD